jgi:tRNA threonylcarbamoyladenosine biosynthesis protein TsaB
MSVFLTLAIDTSTTSSSVAVLKNDKKLHEKSRNKTATHSLSLLPDISSVVCKSGYEIADINLVAVTTGPGSFTGLRIGISTAKAIATVISIPVSGVSSLKALVYNVMNFNGYVFPCFDARKKEIYWALYETADNSVREIIPESISAPEEAKKRIIKQIGNRQVLMLGNLFYKEIFSDMLSEKQDSIPEKNHIVRASNVGLIGIDIFRKGNSVDPESLSPLYIRKSEAETNKIMQNA